MASQIPFAGKNISPSAAPANNWIKGLAGTVKWSEATLSWSFATTEAHGLYNSSESKHLQTKTVTGIYNPLDGSAYDQALMADVRWAMQSISAITGLELKEVEDPDGYAGADLKIVAFDSLNALGVGTFPGTDPSGENGRFEGFTFLATTGGGMVTAPLTGAGSNRVSTSLHEILHTLGLAHPHDGGNGTTAWTTSELIAKGEQDLDNRRYTVMSYERGGLEQNAQDLAYGASVTPMALDVAALHHLYGSGENHVGDTTYRLSDPETFDLDVRGDDGLVTIGRAVFCIWDTGGSDQIVYDGDNHALINLNSATLTTTSIPYLSSWIGDVASTAPFANLSEELKREIIDPAHNAGGFFSRVYDSDGSAFLGGYSIANGVYADAAHRANAFIENATGSRQADIIVGNNQSNILSGGAGDDVLHGSGGGDVLLAGDGDDTIFGGSGDDVIVGGAGADTIDGQEGDDLVVAEADASGGGSYRGGGGTDTFDASAQSWSADAVIDLSAGFWLVAQVRETVLGFENARGGDGATGTVETVIGTALANSLDGNGGDDTLLGLGGDDILNGGAGDDQLEGAGGMDRLCGADGDDRLAGGSGNDWLSGDSGDDSLSGGPGADKLVGDGGDDTISGDEGNDRIYAEDGDDVAMGGAGDDRVEGQEGDDTLHGGDGNDDLRGGGGADEVFGGSGHDKLRGDAGDDLLSGGDGDDYLFGHDGSDRLEGGAGDDWLYGGTGDDTFVISAGPAATGTDKIFGGTGFDTVLLNREAAHFDISLFDSYTRLIDLTAGDEDLALIYVVDAECLQFLDATIALGGPQAAAFWPAHDIL